MRSAGLRLTRQRRILAEIFDAATEHLDAETILTLAVRKDPTVHRATVYRTLLALKRLRLVDELDLMHVTGERHFYEIRPEALHIHLVCAHCKSVEEPRGEFWEGLKHRVQRTTGFRPEVIRIEMAGQCRNCGRKASRKGA